MVGSYEPIQYNEHRSVHKLEQVESNGQYSLSEPNSQWKNINELYAKLKISSLPLTIKVLTKRSS